MEKIVAVAQFILILKEKEVFLKMVQQNLSFIILDSDLTKQIMAVHYSIFNILT